MSGIPVLVPIHATNRCTLRLYSGTWIHNWTVGFGSDGDMYWHSEYTPGSPPGMAGTVPTPAWPSAGPSTLKSLRFASLSAKGHIGTSGPQPGVADGRFPTIWSEMEWCQGFAYGLDGGIGGQRRLDKSVIYLFNYLDLLRQATGDNYRLLVIETVGWSNRSPDNPYGKCFFAEGKVMADHEGSTSGYESALATIAALY